MDFNDRVQIQQKAASVRMVRSSRDIEVEVVGDTLWVRIPGESGLGFKRSAAFTLYEAMCELFGPQAARKEAGNGNR